MYRTLLTRAATKQLAKISSRDRPRIVAAIERLGEDPFEPSLNLKKLTDEDGYRLRVGEYRIIYTIRSRELLIVVIKIGHRRDVYD